MCIFVVSEIWALGAAGVINMSPAKDSQLPSVGSLTKLNHDISVLLKANFKKHSVFYSCQISPFSSRFRNKSELQIKREHCQTKH